MKTWIRISLTVVAALLSLAVLTIAVVLLAVGSGTAERYSGSSQKEVALMDRFDTALNNRISDAMEGVLAIEKVYWLSDDELVAPEPSQDKYGTTTDASKLGALLEKAAQMLDVQEPFLFHTGVKIAPGSEIIYYLDETIFAITWKEVLDGGVYTFSEVKIAHPSQFRRFLSGGEYGSEIRLKTTQMAQSVNAVLASSGDFYGFRQHGVIVYDGVVRRVNSGWVDTCYIDENGDMLVTYVGQLRNREEAQRFVDARKIRFSMAFGPVLVENGEPVDIPFDYFLGQIEDPYPRAALCQKGKLHYIIAVVNAEGDYKRTADIYSFAWQIQQLDVQTAYTLDGGQTAAIVMNDKLINSVLKGSQRDISDIFYFATALPNGG